MFDALQRAEFSAALTRSIIHFANVLTATSALLRRRAFSRRAVHLRIDSLLQTRHTDHEPLRRRALSKAKATPRFRLYALLLAAHNPLGDVEHLEVEYAEYADVEYFADSDFDCTFCDDDGCAAKTEFGRRSMRRQMCVMPPMRHDEPRPF